MKLDDMELFVEVVKCGSFTKASELCGIPKSTLSRRIRQLEDSLQTRLLERTTRKLVLTEVGDAFFFKANQILQEVQATEAEITQSQSHITGSLTLFAPDCLLALCTEHIHAFCKAYPNLTLHVHSTTKLSNGLSDQRFDLLVSVGDLPDSSFIAHPIAKMEFDYFVSPLLSPPADAKTLTSYPALVLQHLTHQPYAWHRSELPEPTQIQCKADSPYLLRALAVAGQGVVCLPTILVEKELKEGLLVRLPHLNGRFYENIYCLYHSRRYVPQRVKVLIEDIRNLLQEHIHRIEKSLMS
ncbi:LysR family transcriptional regulator [Vibrio vulnificus]|nr:LysR family transcriptional regulator [Vibrio vulnificus]